MLLENIQEVNQLTGGAINVSVNFEALRPYYRKAFKYYISPYVPTIFMVEVEAALNGENTEQKYTDLRPYLVRVLAPFTVYEYSFAANAQLGSMGFTRPDGESTKTAYKYQTNDHRRSQIQLGYSELEDLLVYLEDNASNFPTWANSDGASRHRELLIRYSNEFANAHSYGLDRYTFEALRPLIRDVQIFVAESLLGPDLLQILLDAISANNISEERAELITRLQRSLAAFAVYEAQSRFLLEIEGTRLVQREQLEPQSNEKESVPALSAINLAAMQNQEFAERHLSYVQTYLTDNADSFPEYVAYQAAIAAAKEAAQESGQTVTLDPWTCGHPGREGYNVITSSGNKVVRL